MKPPTPSSADSSSSTSSPSTSSPSTSSPSPGTTSSPSFGTPATCKQRLQKLMATAGIASRRACEEIIAAERVTVNGSLAILGDKASWQDRIEVDAVPLTNPETTTYFLLNKPVGVLCTAHDPQGRPTVLDLIAPASPVPASTVPTSPAQTSTVPASPVPPSHPPRLYPVGRLDADSEGIIIVTNDGELTHLLTHPSHGVDKEYLVHVQGKPSRNALRMLRNGIELEDGITAPAKVSQLQDGVLSLVIHEGRNRQIRRMCEAVGHSVQRLIRVRIGPLSQDLAPGQCRQLTIDEVRALYAAAKPIAKPTTEPTTSPTPNPAPPKPPTGTAKA